MLSLSSNRTSEEGEDIPPGFAAVKPCDARLTIRAVGAHHIMMVLEIS